MNYFVIGMGQGLVVRCVNGLTEYLLAFALYYHDSLEDHRVLLSALYTRCSII